MGAGYIFYEVLGWGAILPNLNRDLFILLFIFLGRGKGHV